MKAKNEVQKLEVFKTAWSGHLLGPLVARVVVAQQVASPRPLVASPAAGGKGHTDISTPGGGGQCPCVKRGPASPY